MQKISMAIAATLSACVFATAYGQEVKPDRAIKYRQGVLRAQGWNAGIMGSMVKGEQPYDKDAFTLHAVYRPIGAYGLGRLPARHRPGRPDQGEA